jgi:Icc-related predicted phosphoesterase
MNIYIAGDIHGRFDLLNIWIRDNHPDILICCGDFGYWPRDIGNLVDQIVPGSTKIFFCDGNHEQHDLLDQLKKDQGLYPINVTTNTFFCPRGTIINFNGYNFLFFGGADSIDKNMRTIKFDWFPQEVISYTDVEVFMEHNSDRNVDVVISHTCPNIILDDMLKYNGAKTNDPSCKALDFIYEHTKPKMWYFGHWHHYREIKKGDTLFTGLNMIPHTGWIVKFKF